MINLSRFWSHVHCEGLTAWRSLNNSNKREFVLVGIAYGLVASLGITLQLDLSDPGSSCMLFAMFGLCGTPTIQKGLLLSMGFMSWRSLFFATFSLAKALLQRAHPGSATLAITIVSRVLSNNLGTLGGILSRLTGMWDETISSGVATEGAHVCGICNWFIYFVTGMQSDCEICYCNAALQRRREPLWKMKVGEGSSWYVAGPSQSLQTFQERW